MSRSTRRDALLLTASVGALGLSGCIDDPAGEADEPTDLDPIEYEAFQLGATQHEPLWTESDRAGFAALVDRPADLPMPTEEVTAVDGLGDWLDEFDPEGSQLLALQSAGPNACYTDLEIEAVGLTTVTGPDGDDVEVVTASATAVEENDQVCAEVISYPTALVALPDEDLPDEVSVTITDGWGETETVDSFDGMVDPADLPGWVRPRLDPQRVPDALECDREDFARLWGPDDEGVQWGEIEVDGEPALVMRVHNPLYDETDGGPAGGDNGAGDERDDEDRDGARDAPLEALRFDRGDEVRISMHNVTDESVTTGNASKYSLQVLTHDGWIEVRGSDPDDMFGYTDEGIMHPPGEGFEWSFELTPEGILEGHAHEDRMAVCPGLPAGRYRFAFWGAIGDDALAVAFDLVD